MLTNVNGDIVSYTSKTVKIKQVILPSNISPNVNVSTPYLEWPTP